MKPIPARRFGSIAIRHGSPRQSPQVLLLPDQDLLLIVSEKGEGALVQASPEQHKELSRMPMVTGKTWNHPVLAHGKLFVRNDEEAACYQLNEESPTSSGGAGK